MSHSSDEEEAILKMDLVVNDVRELMMSGSVKIDTNGIAAFGVGTATALERCLKRQAETEPRTRKPGSFYFSELGESCPRRMWFKINTPNLGEELAYHTRIKFLYGDVVEEMVLSLVELSGHEVTHRQENLEWTHPNVEGFSVRGRTDCVIDGILMDVKGASKFGYEKFLKHEVLKNDNFGYGPQLGGYLFTMTQPKYGFNVNPSAAGFLAIQRDLGHITADMYTVEELPIQDYTDMVAKVKFLSSGYGEHIPHARLPDVPEGAKGNMKLGTKCSYCEFKQACWPGLRTYSYSNGPMFLTKVVSEPKVPEIK